MKIAREVVLLSVVLAALGGCEKRSLPGHRVSELDFTLTDGTIHVSIVCNRDKRGAPAFDAACEAMAAGITAKPPKR